MKYYANAKSSDALPTKLVTAGLICEENMWIFWIIFLLVGTGGLIYIIVSETIIQDCLGVAFAYSWFSGVFFGMLSWYKGKKKGYDEGYYKAKQKYTNPNDYYDLR